MVQNSSHLKQALAVATITELRAFLRGQLDRFEFIGEIVQRHIDRAVEMGDLLETVVSPGEFRQLCEEAIKQHALFNQRIQPPLESR